MASVGEVSSAVENDAPKDIKFDTIVVDVDFHPSKEIIVAGNIDGDITLHSYSLSEENREVMSLTHHQKACRCVQFSPSGALLMTGSKDKSLCVVDMDKGALVHQINKAHSSPMYSMYVVDDNIVATGDDEGNLKVWDLRTQNAVMSMNENDDFISDMVLSNNKRLLLATSGDGTLSSYDIRKHKLKLQSELFECELLSLAIMKKGEKVVCGDGEGALNVFNWGEWGNISDRFPGHPMSIDCMLPYNDEIVFTGSFDGMVRAVNIFPNRFLGVVGEHSDFPVENITLSHCRTYVASCSHDQNICFWNVKDIENEEINTKKKAKKTNAPKFLNKVKAKDDFFAGLAEENQGSTSKDAEDSDDDDSDFSDVKSDEEGDIASGDSDDASDDNDSDNVAVEDVSNSESDRGDDDT